MENKKSLPLAGINVIELATVVAAPAVGRVLATYGANVIKIEAPPDGDLIRGMSKGHQLPSEPYNSPLFDVLNSGKKTISINLKSEKGKEALHKLLEQSDIFITNVRMKSLIRMGLGYDALKDKYPRLIYGHFSGFGLEGPDADRPGFDTTAFWLRSGAIMDWVVPGSFVIRPSFGFGDLATS
ncbi:MAG TPA: CoA transferase, partial [Treponemataceae bacterium]|nr:CoA transferase [Treponemataceae bacterium]